ncbi:MAG: mandelate racemase/muconate lactonizing enzyme family protein [Proteobacteria bacterium]|nr:mandelate racemase/muconate lactonizing enzyme family protein [Pseudomonadota bacterium]
MKITALKAHPVSVPLPATFWVGNTSFDKASVIVVEVETDQGITGLATLHGRAMKTVCSVIHELQDLVTGMDPMAHEAIWESVFALTTKKPDGKKKTARSAILGAENRDAILTALAGIDVGVWDIKGKALGLPVWKLLGGKRRELPTYVTGGYYRSDSREGDLRDEMLSYRELGFDAVKIKIGAASLKDDVKRIAEVRDAMGPSAQLMLDGNGAYALHEAEAAIKVFAEYDLTWFEEPLHWYDSIRALGKLAQRTHVPIASGESEMHAWACRDLVDLGGVRVMQFDATRAGGVTEWLRVASYCHLQGVRMSTHHEPHIQGHLAAAAPNGWNVETFPNAERDPIFASMYASRAELKNGKLLLGDAPGFGFTIDWDFVKRHAA